MDREEIGVRIKNLLNRHIEQHWAKKGLEFKNIAVDGNGKRLPLLKPYPHPSFEGIMYFPIAQSVGVHADIRACDLR